VRRRKQSRVARPIKSYNIRKDIQPARLQAIGAVILSWNYVEGALNIALALSLKLPFFLWLPVHSRINGLDGKIAIIKTALHKRSGIPEKLELMIRKALNAVEKYKRYRDGVAHATLWHPDQVIVDTAQRKGIEDEVLLSQDALDALNDHLEILCVEIDNLVSLIHHLLIGKTTGDETLRQSSLQDFRQAIVLLRHAQESREAMKPLPDFPEEVSEASAPDK
jgi:hypothetical protein